MKHKKKKSQTFSYLTNYVHLKNCQHHLLIFKLYFSLIKSFHLGGNMRINKTNLFRLEKPHFGGMVQHRSLRQTISTRLEEQIKKEKQSKFFSPDL